LALGRPPEAVVDDAGIFRHQLILQMHGAAVDGDALDGAVPVPQDRAARRFVKAARLHPDITDLADIEPANAVLRAEAVEFAQELIRLHRLAVDGDEIAALEAKRNGLRLIRGFFRRDGAAIATLGDDLRHFDIRIFERQAFARRVQQVRVDRERRGLLLALRNRDAVLLGVGDEVRAALKLPLAPRRDDLRVRLQRVIADLEADL